jgi:hypothetical protein
MKYDVLFIGYSTIAAPPDDDALIKWQSVSAPVVIDSNFIPALDWAALHVFNQSTNRRIVWQEPDAQDTWQLPEDTFANKRGDCMDIAILKRAMLLQAGVADENIAIIIGEISAMPINLPHAFLIAELDGELRIFDSKFDDLIEPSLSHSFTVKGIYADYINWLPKKLLTGTQCFLFGQQIVLSQTGA